MNKSARTDEHGPTPQDHRGRPRDQKSDDAFSQKSDDAFSHTAPLDEDRGKHLNEEVRVGGCSLLMSMGDNDDCDHNDEDYKEESQPLCKPSSIITKTSDESDDPCLPEDTFSFLIICSHVCSRTFFLATFVFTFQIAIYALLAYDITDLSNPINPFKLPTGVETSVRIAELFAIVVAIITQDDVRKAVCLIREGFNQDLPKAFDGATKEKWILSIVLRAIEGLLGLFLTFLLIMQSTTVLDLLLNFLAMEFVSQLDDVVFLMTREGFLGRLLMNEAKKLSNTHFVNHSSELERSTRAASLVTVAYFIVLFAAFLAAWGIILTQQKDGKYLCQHIVGQFGDEVLPMLGSVTGLFTRYTCQRHQNDCVEFYGGRLSYRDDQDGGALLAYCEEQKRWTLSLTTDNHFDPCNWIAASDESIDFDVLTTATSQWVVRDSAMGILPLSHHFLLCYDRKHVDDLCGESGKVGEDDKCKCSPDFYGLRCEYYMPCDTLGPRKDDDIVKIGGANSSYFASTYCRLEGAEAYNFPIYTSSLDNLLEGANVCNSRYDDSDINLGDNQVPRPSNETDIDIILFTGVRWILSYKSSFPGLDDVDNVSDLAEYFSKFRGHFTGYDASYVSKPVYYSQALYIDTGGSEIASPQNLGRWQYSSASHSQLTIDQQLQPDTEKSSDEFELSCYDPPASVEGPPAQEKGMTISAVGLAVILLVAVLVAFCVYRKCAACKHDAESEKAQIDVNEELDVENDLNPAAADQVDC